MMEIVFGSVALCLLVVGGFILYSRHQTKRDKRHSQPVAAPSLSVSDNVRDPDFDVEAENRRAEAASRAEVERFRKQRAARALRRGPVPADVVEVHDVKIFDDVASHSASTDSGGSDSGSSSSSGGGSD